MTYFYAGRHPGSRLTGQTFGLGAKQLSRQKLPRAENLDTEQAVDVEVEGYERRGAGIQAGWP
jgi:hypothetical protein